MSIVTFPSTKLEGKKMSKSIFYAASFIFSLFLIGCSSPTSPTSSTANYTPLNVGLEKQYYSYTDNAYQTDNIAGKVTREDGQEVFIVKVEYKSPKDNQVDYSYVFTRNGFYYATSLINDKDDSKNPFHEMRIGKLNPKEGDSWVLREDMPDSLKIKFTANYVGELSTPAGQFQNVFDYYYFDPAKNDTTHVYYANGVGNIGSVTGHDKALINYVKTDKEELGQKNSIKP